MNTKKIFFTILSVLIFNLSQAQSFEGIIKMNITNAEKNETSNIVWKMKGNKSRLEYTGSVGDKNYSYVLLMNNAETKVKILTEANGKKVVYTTSVPASTNDNVRYLDHTYLSSNKMIDTYDAEQLTLKAPDKRTVCWISKEAPLTVDMLPPALKANGVLTYFMLKNIKGMPLEIETFDANGKVIFSQKITSIKSAALNDSEFEAGSEYIDPTQVLRAEPTPVAVPQTK